MKDEAGTTGMYTDMLQEHFEQPRNVGVIANANATAEVSNPACGDVMCLYLRIEDNRIVEAKFQTQGCPAAIAAGSITTEMLCGKTVEESLALNRDEVNRALGGLPSQKVHASVLSEDAVRAAIANYRRQLTT